MQMQKKKKKKKKDFKSPTDICRFQADVVSEKRLMVIFPCFHVVGRSSVFDSMLLYVHENHEAF